MASPIVEESVSIPSSDLRLEGILTYPTDGSPAAASVILSPHPHLGGRMDNNVVRHLTMRFAEDGAISLRFNYRGIGRSDIRLNPGVNVFDYWTILERERRYAEIVPDVDAAIAFVTSVAPKVRIVLIGYSLGAVLAGLATQSSAVKAIVAIMPPTRRVTLDLYKECALEKFFVTGEEDFAYNEAAFAEQYARMRDPKHHIRLRGCDHFLRGHEEDLYRAITEVLRTTEACSKLRSQP